ncbi:MAG TPA: DoxX family protein [Pseudonocardiaceae bacterium]|jgi:putative oxidoreductase|nr:DoxX family protein [Pseudonocardiaceae bacterium]
MNPASRAKTLTGPIQSIFRIVVGFLFATHGIASLFGVFGGAPGTHGGTYAFGTWPGWWASAIELACGVLVALGIGTRVAALICSGVMAYAYFTVHIEHALLPLENGGEPAALYSWIFLLIAVMGPGPWALRARLGKTAQGSYQPEAEEATA